MVIREIKTTGQDLQSQTQILSQTHRSLQSLFPGRKIGYLPHHIMHCIIATMQDTQQMCWIGPLKGDFLLCYAGNLC